MSRVSRGIVRDEVKFYVCAGDFSGYLFMGNAWRKWSMRNGMELAREIQLDWLVNDRKLV